MPTKTLRRSNVNKALFGVCGGLAEYFDVDPVLIRIAFVLLAFANGLGILAYIVLAVVMPSADSEAVGTSQTVQENLRQLPDEAAQAGRRMSEAIRQRDPETSQRRQNTLALALIVIGLVFLVFNLGGFFFWWFSWGTLWPLVLIAIGIGLLITRARRA
jgi:phage shock protein PspC (stress-responsive transcriptional regulator)